jgi:hypothetical protein
MVTVEECRLLADEMRAGRPSRELPEIREDTRLAAPGANWPKRADGNVER